MVLHFVCKLVQALYKNEAYYVNQILSHVNTHLGAQNITTLWRNCRQIYVCILTKRKNKFE